MQERILPPPVLARPKEAGPDDWTSQPLPPRPDIVEPRSLGEPVGDDDPRMADRRQQPELDRMKTIERKAPLDNEFSPDYADDLAEDAPQVGRMNEIMQRVARQSSLDRGDDLGL